MIKVYERSDYEFVIELLEACDLPSVTIDELDGFGLIWKEDDRTIGFTWALINHGATAYIDHVCVHPGFRDKDTERSKILVDLMIAMMSILAKQGKTRIQGVLQDTPYGKALERTYWKLGMKIARPHAYVYGSIPEVLYNLQEMKHVKHYKDNDTRPDA